MSSKDAIHRVKRLSIRQLAVCWALAWDVSYTDMARLLGMSEEAVRITAFRAKRKLGLKHIHAIPLVLILAQGFRHLEHVEFPHPKERVES